MVKETSFVALLKKKVLFALSYCEKCGMEWNN